MKILLTNDDSHSSPLFLIAIEKLKTLGNLTIVVPKEEQSWTGKSISYSNRLRVDEIRLNGHQAYCVNGKPADCSNIGIYHICEARPDLVVSGINIGINTGLGYVLSSGTVGACLEANISGIPAVALSQDIERKTFFQWKKSGIFEEEIIKQLNQQSGNLLNQVFSYLMEQDGLLNKPVTWNVNLPFNPTPASKIIRTFLGHTFYTSCFIKDGDRFRHHLDKPPVPDTRENADGVVVRQGNISINKIDIRDLGR